MATDNAPRGFPRILQWLLAGLMLIIGLAIGILGAKLASVGGTFYFARWSGRSFPGSRRKKGRRLAWLR